MRVSQQVTGGQDELGPAVSSRGNLAPVLVECRPLLTRRDQRMRDGVYGERNAILYAHLAH